MVTKETAPAPRKLGRPPLGTEGEATTRILAAAKPIFLREGYDATSIDAIAASASISKTWRRCSFIVVPPFLDSPDAYQHGRPAVLNLEPGAG